MIRYKADILEKLKGKGYTSYRMRKEGLLSEGTLQKVRVGDASISIASLNVICRILQCQPGDLIEWIPEGTEE